jgi:hypothetical protein
MHAVIEQLRVAEQDAIEARQEADIAESKAFLRADGAEYKRKHTARIEVADLELQALTKEATVRHLVRLLREAQARVDAGRTYSADLRAELSVLGQTGTA